MKDPALDQHGDANSKAVIFDMDGVIVNSEPLHERAFLDVMQAIGYGDRHGIRFADYVGRSDKVLWQDFLAMHRPPYSADQLLAMKSRRVVEIIGREKPLFPGLPELVAQLAARYRLALASGSERTIVDAVLGLGNLQSYFHVTVSDTEIPRGKPAPDIFLRAAELLGVAPGNCWVIEDSIPGIAASLAAGMRVIAIPNTHPAEELRHATHVAKDYEEIGKLLR